MVQSRKDASLDAKGSLKRPRTELRKILEGVTVETRQ